MNTAVERIRDKIAELEKQIGDLRITEKELLALGVGSVPARETAQRPRPVSERKSRARSASRPGSTIGAAVVDVLSAKGGLPASDIAEQIRAEGREIDNRQVSFALQGLKKQGNVKSANGKWSLTKAGKAKAETGREHQAEPFESV